jgi:hypothetical protein
MLKVQRACLLSRSEFQYLSPVAYKCAYRNAHMNRRFISIGLPADKSADVTDCMQQPTTFRTDVHTSPLGRSNTQAKSFADPFSRNVHSGSQAIDRGNELLCDGPTFREKNSSNTATISFLSVTFYPFLLSFISYLFSRFCRFIVQLCYIQKVQTSIRILLERDFDRFRLRYHLTCVGPDGWKFDSRFHHQSRFGRNV